MTLTCSQFSTVSCWEYTQRMVQSRLQSSLHRSHESGYMCSCIKSTLLLCKAKENK